MLHMAVTVTLQGWANSDMNKNTHCNYRNDTFLCTCWFISQPKRNKGKYFFPVTCVFQLIDFLKHSFPTISHPMAWSLTVFVNMNVFIKQRVIKIVHIIVGTHLRCKRDICEVRCLPGAQRILKDNIQQKYPLQYHQNIEQFSTHHHKKLLFWSTKGLKLVFINLVGQICDGDWNINGRWDDRPD